MPTGHYNLAVMPKRRVPGHLQRTGRRRRDRQPNVPPPVERPTDRPSDAAEATEQVGTTAGRPLRPTLRGAGGTGARFVRSAPAPLDLSTEYRYVVRDLRQIGLLAAVAFVILGVLAFVIR
jgi:hypothetical protein